MTAVFVDTNVLVYAIDRADEKKHHRARGWSAELWRSRQGRVSYQVLQEFYVTVARKRPAARGEARATVRDLLAWRPVSVDGDLLDRGWGLQDRYQLSFWDALVVAAAQAATCSHLLSEDLKAGQDFDGVVVVNPFMREPGPLA
jgi:predicted nucleic acid-binding protein